MSMADEALELMREWDKMGPEEQMKEISKGSTSEYYMLFEDDPVVVAYCPEHGSQVVGADLYCDGGHVMDLGWAR